MNRLFLLAGIMLFGWATPSMAQLASATFVHSSPDPSLRVVDLYVTQAGIIYKVDDIAFQKASNLTEVAIFGDLEVTLSVAPSTSAGISESIYETVFTPEADKAYMAIFSGVRKPSDYLPNPSGKSTALAITTYEVPSENTNPSKTAVYIFNASTDLEAGDVYARGTDKALAANVAYLDRSLTAGVLDRKSVTIDYTKPGEKTKVLASFSVDLAALSSDVLICVISGFKTPGDNSKSLDTLALLSVLEDGRVSRSPLIAGSQTCRVQIVHAAADPAYGVVDLWVNGTKQFDNVTFRKASAFVDVAANTPLVIGLAPATSTAYKDTLGTITLDPLRPSRAYTIVALGVSDTSKFAKNPDGADPRFKLSVFEGALEKNATTKTGVRTLHAVTDASRVSFAGATASFASKLGYGEMTPTYVETEPTSDTVWMTDGDGKKLKGFICDFRGAARATILIATGFADPAANGSGPGLSVILVDANGNVNGNIPAIDPPDPSSVSEQDLFASGWRLGPNPSSDVVQLEIPVQTDAIVYSVLNTQGETVLSGALQLDGQVGTALLRVADMAPGAYRVVARSASGTLLGSMGLIVRR